MHVVSCFVRASARTHLHVHITTTYVYYMSYTSDRCRVAHLTQSESNKYP